MSDKLISADNIDSVWIDSINLTQKGMGPVLSRQLKALAGGLLHSRHFDMSYQEKHRCN